MRMTQRFTRLLSVMVSAGLVLAAGSVAAQETITLGFTGPLSGGAAIYGKNCLSGMKMAEKEINANGGFEVNGKKYNLEVVALDDKYSPAEAGVNARRLVQANNAPVVFCPHSGGIFALQAFNERENFVLAAYSSVPSITERGNKLTVRIPPSFDVYLKPFSKYTMERFGKKVAVANATHDYAKYWTKLFVPVWEEMGGEVVADNPMDYNKDTDFYSGMSRVLAAKPDVLFIGGASEPTALVAKQARELGFKGGFVVMDQAKLDEMARVLGSAEALEGAIGVTPLMIYGTDSAAAFVERYKKAYDGNIPGSEAAFHYFATYLFTEAMNQAGTTEDAKAIRANIAKALKAIPSENSPYGTDTISETGALEGDPNVAVVEDGKIKRTMVKDIMGK